MRFDIRRVARIALSRRHEFIVAVATIATDHRLIVIVGFAGALAVWYIINAVIEGWRRAARATRRWLSAIQATFANGTTVPPLIFSVR